MLTEKTRKAVLILEGVITFLIGFATSSIISLLKLAVKKLIQQFSIKLTFDNGRERCVTEWIQSRNHKNIKDISVNKSRKVTSGDYRFAPSQGAFPMWWDGTLLVISCITKRNDSFNENRMYEITIFSFDLTKAKKLIEEIEGHSEIVSMPDGVQICIPYEALDEWQPMTKANRRSIKSVIWDKGILENLLEDIKRFMASKDEYIHKGIPYRRGYLLYGEPGNGKTSGVLAIASELNLDVKYLPLSMKNLGDLNIKNLMSQANHKDIILIEDVDSVFEQRNKEISVKENTLTFAGFLNSIDGILGANGRILIMTTNYIEKLDSALIRPGRIDMQVKIGNATHDQIARIFLHFYPDEVQLSKKFADSFNEHEIPMCVFQQHFIENKTVNDAILNIDKILNKDNKYRVTSLKSLIPHEEKDLTDPM